MVSTDYETYAIMDVQLHRGAASIGVLKLYSKPRGRTGGSAASWGPSSDGAEGAGAGWGGGERGRGTGGAPAHVGTPSFTGRALEHDKEVLKKFHQAAKDYGLSPKDVHLNTWDSECCAPPASPPPRPPLRLTLPLVHSDLRQPAAAGELCPPPPGAASPLPPAPPSPSPLPAPPVHLSFPPHVEGGVWGLRGAVLSVAEPRWGRQA